MSIDAIDIEPGKLYRPARRSRATAYILGVKRPEKRAAKLHDRLGCDAQATLSRLRRGWVLVWMIVPGRTKATDIKRLTAIPADYRLRAVKRIRRKI